MSITAHPSEVRYSLTVEELQRHGQMWLLDVENRYLSPHTVARYRFTLDRLVEHLQAEGAEVCGRDEIRSFLGYVRRGAGKPSTVLTRFRAVHTFFGWLVEEKVLPASPLDRMKAPTAREDQVQPFSPEQVKALLAAARESRYHRRNRAVLLLLLDTGARASELCSLDIGHLDFSSSPARCSVQGKGDKARRLILGRKATRALWDYLRRERRDPDEPLFLSEGGKGTGGRLTRSGLQQLFERLGERAGVAGVRCSPHTCRHTFAVSFLRNGGNTFTLQELLGHASLTMVRRYVRLAEADLAEQHRLYSPGDRLAD